jgi:hypothetical protein
MRRFFEIEAWGAGADANLFLVPAAARVGGPEEQRGIPQRSAHQAAASTAVTSGT